MREDMDRREFLKSSAALSTAASLALGGANRVNAKPKKNTTAKSSSMPRGTIGDLQVSRLISGGNLLGGWAHARDLNYVGQLMRHYNTEKKILDTLERMEKNGVDTIIAYIHGKTPIPGSTQKQSIMEKYWEERGGSMKWIAQCTANVKDLYYDIDWAVDHGACAAYMNGGLVEKWAEQDRHHLLGKCVDRIKQHDIPAGYGAHKLDHIIAAESGGVDPDFYMKTLHPTDYWSFTSPREHNNAWATDPKRTIEYMKDIDTPWIAFKVLAAGAVHPGKGFRFAFENGADFICVGMFDWQVEEDVKIARRTVRQVKKAGRQRRWHG